ncbi:MAG: hypothetical protein PHU88_09620 [candidate division Zixibacteria bacterium]|nr:hypothetical protein [candidate division Zixibacteria bacterium]MDD5425337.1 hypothetical protein [candidate division Zixibacteria bacterium]
MVINSSANEYRSNILQLNQDRLYFSAGEEANIFPCSKFKVFCSQDSLYSGTIEKSYLGVSYSTPTGGFFDSVYLGSCFAVIETAGIDSQTIITVGLSAMDSVEQSILFFHPLKSADYPLTTLSTSAGNRILILSNGTENDIYDSSLIYDIDIHITYDSQYTTPPPSTTKSSRAPFLAVLLPNLSKASSVQGILTTSLYYRFSAFLLPYLFEGDLPVPVYSFFTSDDSGRRPYPYDPQKGKVLLTRLAPRPEQLNLSFEHPSLQKVALYFADILAREKIRVDITTDSREADLILTYIPAGDLSTPTGLEYLISILEKFEPAETSQIENLKIISDYLEASQKTDKPDIKEKYYTLAEQGLIHDLGIFPLFRPTLFMTCNKYIGNCHFDENGRFDYRNLTRLKLPATEKERVP